MSQQWSTVPEDSEEKQKKVFKPYNAELGNEIEMFFMHSRSHQHTTAALVRDIVTFRSGRDRPAKEVFDQRVNDLFPLVSDCLNHVEGPFTREMVKRSGRNGSADFNVVMWSHNLAKSQLFTTQHLPLNRFGYPGGVAVFHVPKTCPHNASDISDRINSILLNEIAPPLGARFLDQ